MLRYHWGTRLAQRLRRCSNAPSRHVRRHSSWQKCGQANPSSQGDHRRASGAGHRRSSRRNHGAVKPPLWVYQHAANPRLQDRSVEGGALEEVADRVLVALARPLVSERSLSSPEKPRQPLTHPYTVPQLLFWQQCTSDI
ncbi:UNVERIFIED_CONTAM: hypothetical protein FKN15_053968 [Acipenser sinensis]